MSQNPDQSTSGTAREAQAPAPLSFEAQILALLPTLRRYSRSLTRSDTESEDLLQDCVEKALLSRAQWRGSNFKSWTYRIMTNLHLNARRSVARRPSVGIEEAETVAASTSADDPLEKNRLVQALETLPKDARAVLMLVVVEGYAYQEVADMLEIPVGTVMSRLSRARQALREKMREENVIPLRRPR
ncbi:RNA polymerase sigma factor [Neorhizobium galegae]|uniref:RNA polymerase sigma factor n=1 Tax=Neorhizobium galegae bv. orientalis str. HAMBI 540 TaxID=1028800 RepID=A0A068SPQ7_NEOGA|nr:RNA polymerase sigma factor [Neorhizobium galegae]CDN48282.1 RNA polymerase sigma factor [Neorhizobium galegae bv. orientalis str. HAMBI 540]CDZ46263.1 ECF family RNA polymerase sigma factor [Neorhizobium galegae bv. orientalis]